MPVKRELGRAVRITAVLAAGLSLGATTGCDDRPSRTAHAHRRGQRKSPSTVRPAKRTGEFSLHVDRAPFIGAGCEELENGDLDCSRAAFVREFHCHPRLQVNDLLGGLTVKPIAIAACLRSAQFDGVVDVGCREPVSRSYVVFKDAKFELIDSRAEFRDRFGPTGRPESALGFALALTRFTRAMFQVRFDDDAPVAPDTLPTNVLKRPEGSVVRLFQREPCGCKHPDEAHDYLVTRDGDVTLITRKTVHVNPDEQGRCVD
jgi:hypothetical protein